jgi:hypothetical protein
MRKRFPFCLAIAALLLIVPVLSAQIDHYLPDKSGEWKPVNKFSNDNCTYLAEKSAYLANMMSVAEWVHRNNLVVTKPTGFDAKVNFTQPCSDIVNNSAYRGYGYQGEFTIHFQLFFININTGKEDSWDNYCPNISIAVNQPISAISSQYDEAGFKTGNPLRLKQPLEEALENLKQYYNVSPVEKEIAPGVRIYANGYIVVFNPDRPDFWVPVTVKEVMEAKLAYYKVKKEIDDANDARAVQEWAKLGFVQASSFKVSVYDAIKKEYENFTSEELNSRAYYSSGDGTISCINANEKGWPVMRFNPECWDCSLPQSAVQFVSMPYQPRSETDLEDFCQRNDNAYDYAGLFTNAMPVERMAELIRKR